MVREARARHEPPSRGSPVVAPVVGTLERHERRHGHERRRHGPGHVPAIHLRDRGLDGPRGIEAEGGGRQQGRRRGSAGRHTSPLEQALRQCVQQPHRARAAHGTEGIGRPRPRCPERVRGQDEPVPGEGVEGIAGGMRHPERGQHQRELARVLVSAYAGRHREIERECHAPHREGAPARPGGIARDTRRRDPRRGRGLGDPAAPAVRDRLAAGAARVRCS